MCTRIRSSGEVTSVRAWLWNLPAGQTRASATVVHQQPALGSPFCENDTACLLLQGWLWGAWVAAESRSKTIRTPMDRESKPRTGQLPAAKAERCRSCVCGVWGAGVLDCSGTQRCLFQPHLCRCQHHRHQHLSQLCL